ncbi:MAG: 4-hydroxy-3-methylbut-2-enyl diphosphate reductase [Desulfobacteraceae bacterium]|nr:4-hydroxy-3-methylbut-2-enyl diphosphate reductase [Desulfobacteraceae bacterium]
MKVITARTAGFCKGVRDAIEITMEAIQQRQEDEDICTFGPLIHNRQVLLMLEKKGVVEQNRIEDCAGKKVVIRAHGIPPDTRQELHLQGANLLDATCKRVARVHAAIKRHARRGYYTIIVGDADHAEVIGLLGYTEGRGIVINRPEQIEQLPAEWVDVLLVAQTTQNEEVFREIEEAFLKKYPNGIVKNTICDSTQERQAEVRSLCSQVEAMVIVGGLHSGNTIRLAEVARDCAIPTFHIETEADLNEEEMACYSCVGVSAGASTPNWIIRNVVEYLDAIRPEKRRFPSKAVMERLAYSNVYIALGTAFLPATAQALSGFRGTAALGLMAAAYAFAVHSLNIYLDRDAIQLNDPGRAAFYQKWRVLFTLCGVASVATALMLALHIGKLNFLAMLLLTMSGLSYGVPLILPAWWEKFPVKLKDIPTSKTFFVPMAWAAVSVLLPHFTSAESLGRLAFAFWIVFLLALVRTVLLDFLAVQGDRLVGKETLVVLAGERRTAYFTSGILLLLVLSLIAGYKTGLATGFALYMLIPTFIYGFYLKKGRDMRIREDPVYETMIEVVLIGTGLGAVLWLLFK